MLVPVLLSGGVGSRLWPVSRAGRPKQFLPLGGEGSMLQETLRRLQGLECGAPVVVCNAEHRFMVAEQLRGESTVPPEIILEPAGRNTAPAIALAALQVSQRDPESLLLVLPADHHIVEPRRFCDAVEHAARREDVWRGANALDPAVAREGADAEHPGRPVSRFLLATELVSVQLQRAEAVRVGSHVVDHGWQRPCEVIVCKVEGCALEVVLTLPNVACSSPPLVVGARLSLRL